MLENEDREHFKDYLESLVGDLEQHDDGRLCGVDANKVIQLVKDKLGLFKHDRVLLLEGPLEHYNHKLGKIVTSRHHLLPIFDESWIIDIAQKPGERVFYDLDDYNQNSGIVYKK